MIQFLLDNEIRRIDSYDPTQTVLEWLREDQCRTGTKEGCAEGDCGACTVVIGELIDDIVRYRAVNACIFFLPMLDGKELVTVETLGSARNLHPVQQAMADGNGTQCGFCTPGFVMSLFARYQQTDPALPDQTDDVLAGNLCRCTGYAPIQKAAESLRPSEAHTGKFGGPETLAALKSIQPSRMTDSVYHDPNFETERHYFAPRTEAELLDLLAQHPDATLVAGATDVGLWVTKQHRLLQTTISLHQINQLQTMEQDGADLRIGAMVRYSDAWAKLQSLHPDLGELVRRLGSVQVRNSGTIGGNIANGSPIGDMPPPLIALSSQLELAGPDGVRVLPLEDFFLDYGKQDLRPGEYVRAVLVPSLAPGTLFRTYKISKRFNQDISALCGAFAIAVEDGHVTDARIAFGGLAGTPKRAEACEAALIGAPWHEDTIDRGVDAMRDDFTPLTDMRASRDYRMTTAQNLLRKVFLESRAENRTRILQAT
ncbi:MAG: xanthine dehydrogenase small subunit [Pseudomonadota bacterium]